MRNKGIISLLGCGWLGFPLAKSLVSKGFSVRATTSTASKLETLQNAGIDSYLVQFSPAGQLADLKKLFEAETLIITIPPGRSNPQGFENYRKMVKAVCQEVPESKVRQLILASSTSVYPDSNSVLDEDSYVRPETDSGRLMAETEEILARLNIKVITLRLGGLVGPGRMPAKFFSGKTDIPNGLAPVNLIHLNDVIGIFHKLLLDSNSRGIYNACSPSHPTREEFYSLAARVEQMEEPRFTTEAKSWKVISSTRVKSELNYNFEISSLMDWLKSLSK